ncbi:MAG TPA: EAL domain-containing protein, partial [Spirochaetia bacterium]|nr:EAL domain-containing protein [Spirochaetia bacterium]
TGHSSLAYLKSLPVNTVKIDRSFVDTLSEDDTEEPFVKYIIELLKIKRKHIIAEGISRVEQVEMLAEMGCDSYQGFYFAEPLPFGAFESFLERSCSERH